ncbi:MAG: RHS repeat protein [Marinilabiliales bacterium]|nr:RHS repeat protein [Marinilabiliales bacterium]
MAEYTMTYDEFGNLKTIERPANAAGDRLKHTYEYDTDVKSMSSRQRILINAVPSAVYDHRFGELLSITDINGQQTQYTLDNAGRILTIPGTAGNCFRTAFSRLLLNTIRKQSYPEALAEAF